MAAQFGQAPVEDIVLMLEPYADRLMFLAQRDGFDRVEGAAVGSNFWARLMTFAKTCAHEDCGRGAAWTARDLAERQDAMARAAQLGAELFREMIPDAANRDRFRRLLADGMDGEAPRIRASSQAALIPWEALCLVEADETPTFKDFLGWRHVIVRNTYANMGQEGSVGTRAPARTTIRRGRARAIREVNSVEDDSLPTVGLKHAKAARERYSSARYRTLHPLTKTPQDLQAFHDFLFPADYRLDLVHFDCHVDLADLRAQSHVQVTKKFAIPFAEFEYPKLDLAHLPVVVFNGCHGGTLGPGEVLSLASRIREAGAASVIAGECELGDDFCLDFALTFYSVAAAARDVGEALLETRRRFLAFDHNPLVLFFGLYGWADVELDIQGCEAPDAGSILEQRMNWPLAA